MANAIVRRNVAAQSTELAKSQPLPSIPQETIVELKNASHTGISLYAQGAGGDIFAALELATMIDKLRSIFDEPEIKARILSLMNSPLGFRTDRDPSVKKWNKQKSCYDTPTEYPYPVVRDAAIEAVLRGLQLAGNQFNIISGRCYCTKEGFESLIRNVKSVTGFRPIIGVPVQKNGGVVIDCTATWDQNGPQSLEAQIPVKTSDTGTADQYIGKAKRKFFERCYSVMTGNSLPEGDASDAVEIIPTAPAPAPKVALAATPVAGLSDGQIEALTTAAQKLLTEVGYEAYFADIYQVYDAELGQVPAIDHADLLKALRNPDFQALWNQGRSREGQELISNDRIIEISKSQAVPVEMLESDATPPNDDEDGGIQGGLL